ncbi:MAG: hypothetical protein ACJ8GK_13375 [Luteimonas sp.]
MAYRLGGVASRRTMRLRAILIVAFASATLGCDPDPQARSAVAPPHPQSAGKVPAQPATTSPPPADPAGDAQPTLADLSNPATYRLPGALTAATTEDWLRQRFGDANVRIADVPGGEGETTRGIVLFPDDSMRRAFLYFQDAERLRGLSLIRIVDQASRWRLEDGIGIGMPLSKLVALNGKPVDFSGFDWDYGGAIGDWNGGRLQPADTEMRRAMIRLRHGAAPAGTYPMGDAMFSSDDPRYPRLGAIAFVGEIGMSFSARTTSSATARSGS